MVRILVILLSLAGLLTAFQNCGSGGTLTIDKSKLSSSSMSYKNLGGCNAAASFMCVERWQQDDGSEAAVWQGSCISVAGSTYLAAGCPAGPGKLGSCELSTTAQEVVKNFYYQGYSMGAMNSAQELANAQASCGSGIWTP